MIDKDQLLLLLKARLGISTNVRDVYLTAIIESIIEELTDEKGITLEEENVNHLMLIVDYASWRYKSRDESGAMPRYLQYRLHNLMIHNGGAAQ